MKPFLLRFAKSEDAAIAPIFAMSFLLLAAAVGVAIDYGRAHAARRNLQDSLDAAVFAAAQDNARRGDNVKTALTRFFEARSITTSGVLIKKLNGGKDGNGFVTGTIEAQVQSVFMRLFGSETIDLNLQSTVAFGSENVEIALVLDTTASMNGTKLDTLKTAAKNLVSTVYQVPDASKLVKVSIVPFANYVNVGMTYRNASWMDVPSDYTDTQNICTTTRPVLSKSNCRMETQTGTNDGVPFTYEVEVCDIQYAPEETNCNDVTYNYQWNGCAGSRNYPLNVQDGSYSTRIPGVLNASCPLAIAPLTNSVSDINTAIDGLTAYGETYIPAGLMWGWRVLSAKEPFDESAKDPNISSQSDVKKYIVLMTDGANTKSAQYPDHWGSDVVAANGITAELCTNIKAEKIRIFTIAFEVTDTDIKTLLKNCASAGGDFYDAVDASQLIAAFNDIGGSITSVRLAK